jgi:hypothetical protein
VTPPRLGSPSSVLVPFKTMNKRSSWARHQVTSATSGLYLGRVRGDPSIPHPPQNLKSLPGGLGAGAGPRFTGPSHGPARHEVLEKSLHPRRDSPPAFNARNGPLVAPTRPASALCPSRGAALRQGGACQPETRLKVDSQVGDHGGPMGNARLPRPFEVPEALWVRPALGLPPSGFRAAQTTRLRRSPRVSGTAGMPGRGLSRG